MFLPCCGSLLVLLAFPKATVVNPETGRPIQVHGATFTQLLQAGGWVYHQKELQPIAAGYAHKEEHANATTEAWYGLEPTGGNHDLLFVYKPPHLLSVPGRTQPACLMTRIQQDYPSARLCHRLDRDTSGVMVVALTAAAHREISQQFERRETRKTYTCLVAGHVARDSDVIDLPIGKQKTQQGYNRWVIGGEKPRAAQTRYTVDQRFTLNNGFAYTRVVVEPLTGRGQQIRLHLHSLGHALLGDTLHAPEDIAAMTPRLCLHATTLAVATSGEWNGRDAAATTTMVQAHAPSPF